MPQDTLPDYHFLLIAPNLGSEWFYDGARRYWLRFFPTVISDLALLRLIPSSFSMAVTVVARRDRIAQLGVELAQVAPGALFDPVVHDFFEDTRAELDRRAELNQPFGVPLRPTETPTPAPTAEQVQPTPGPITGAAQPPTPTPTEPGFLPPRPPDPAEESAEDAGEGGWSQPLYPTPGPITGGGG